ncbi:MAG: hydantoinase/oxoprolinase family protein [Candidatus Eremiobacteraeota bacterium]|nr:hydantoinase/oxoprolinase family protein [Candidatus Eremiobacteraeota bacterium]
MIRVGVDVGGTFTDLAALDTETGERIALKVPSTPRAPEQAVLDVLDALARSDVAFLAHSTTVATNALLGQVGLELPRVGAIFTRGFADVIEIGRQNRSEVYNLFVRRPRPLVAREDRLTVVERIGARGEVLTPLDEASLARASAELRARNVAAVAICLLNSYANDAHERRVEEVLAATLPGVAITRSSAVDPQYREYERFSTAVVNAALAPIVQRYLERLTQRLRERRVDMTPYVMRSDGGLSSAQTIASVPAAIVESGPAAGVIAASAFALPRAIAFDMGGTTAKAGTIAGGSVQLANEFEAAGSTHSGRAIKGSGYPVRFPFVDLAEVSAGGGTLAWIDEAGSLRVGPVSAGADPGPACYGTSDRATVTDANVVLGRLNPVALLGGSFPIDAARSRAAIASLAEAIGLSVEATAAGIVTLVDAEMAKVLRIVTVERGLDPRDFTLVAYGGSGPLHACALASELGMTRAIVPERPGIFSAQGLLVADVVVHPSAPLLCDLAATSIDELEAEFVRLESLARRSLIDQGVDPKTVTLRRTYDARYAGQSFEIPIVHADSIDAIEQAFGAEHRARYGYDVAGERIELVNARLHARGKLPSASLVIPSAARSAVIPSAARSAKSRDHSFTLRSVWIDGAYTDAPVYQRDALPETPIDGPAIIEQYDATTYVAPGWRCSRDAEGALVLRLRAARCAQDDTVESNGHGDRA